MRSSAQLERARREARMHREQLRAAGGREEAHRQMVRGRRQKRDKTGGKGGGETEAGKGRAVGHPCFKHR